MIKLRSILLEQQEAKKLNVLFVTDYPTATVNNYAKSLIATGEITGEIKSYSREDSLEAVSLVAYNISAKIDLLVVQVSGVRDKSGKTLYNNLSKISEIAERKRVPVVFIATPTTDFSNSVKDYDYIDQAYNLLAKRNEVIEMPELNDDSYFSGNGLSLNKAGERIVYAKLASYLKTMDASLDLTPIEEKEPEDAAGHDATHIPNAKQNTISLEPEKNSIGALPVINQAETDWELVMAFLVEKGLSVAGAAGVAGNIKIESNFNPAAVGDRGTSFGLAQWHKDRKDQLVAYAKSKDQHPGDAQLQLEYLWHTLVSSYVSLTNYLKSAKDPRDAAYQFAKQYERPAVISNKRLDYAEQYAKEYDPSIIDRLADLGSNALSSLGAIASTALAAGAYSKYSNKSQIKTNSKNGQLSGSELKSIGNGHSLAPAAADAFLQMKAAAANKGINIKLSDSYRPLSVQHSIFDWDHYHKTGKRRKKGTANTAAAYPGTSNHGLGRAIDVANSAAQDWIRANGEAYGWSWAEGRSVNEPWHFTYVK
jgi:hypothetical protein